MANTPYETCACSGTPPRWRFWPCLKHTLQKLAKKSFQMQYNIKNRWIHLHYMTHLRVKLKYDMTHKCSPLKRKPATFLRVQFNIANLKRSCTNTKAHPPSTLTPLICVRCIFWSRERESATRIFLQPSLKRILETRNQTSCQQTGWEVQKSAN